MEKLSPVQYNTMDISKTLSGCPHKDKEKKMDKKKYLPLEVICLFCFICLSIAASVYADTSDKKPAFNGMKAPAIENRFVAAGKITDIIFTPEDHKDIRSFIMVIEKVEQLNEYPNLGTEYLGKTVEVISEVGIPPAFKSGARVHVILRVAGDEWKQSLYLVEVIENEKE